MVRDTDKAAKKKTRKIGGWFIDLDHYSLLTENAEQETQTDKPDNKPKKDKKKKEKKSLGTSLLAL